VCRPEWYGDEDCDPNNNLPECEWDGGDCCPSTCTGEDCGNMGYDCRDPAAGGDGLADPEPIDAPCAAVDDPLAPESLKVDVARLSSDAAAGRRPGSSGDWRARRYIEDRFACLGLHPAADGCYQVPFHSSKGDPTGNVVGVIPGSDPELAHEIILVGAHHDGVGVEDDVIRPGANDNASGLAAMLAIADLIQRTPNPPRRTVAFVAFGAQNMGVEGAMRHVASPPEGMAMENVVYMVNIDMIGSYQHAGGADSFGTFSDTPGRALVEADLDDQPDLDVSLGVVSDDGSDHAPFCSRGIPFVYLETADDSCWHKACDDANWVDYTNLSRLTLLLHQVIAGLADSDEDLAALRGQGGCTP